ncbi:OsmC family protein [Fulvivirgaceae bacterium BMA10]|uniref:OsmC family protein n=1 Tax=Splendidivirga corallicola TaxID=3051826 RepID=A0ABT8KNT6_9BACT|nr:OsmC family protein [Fulvivirgaceae bacterium BMA10]
MSNSMFTTKQVLRKARILKNPSKVYARHKGLHKRYKENPELAMITDCAEVNGTNLQDPFRTTVSMNKELNVSFKVGVHRAVGGDHDFPNPGDMLCATLASCMESTTRMIANLYNIQLTKTRVHVSAIVDVRGTLRMDLSTPVEFQSMHIDFDVEAEGLNEKVLNMLIQGTKKSCIIYQTLKKGIPVTINVNSKNTKYA